MEKYLLIHDIFYTISTYFDEDDSNNIFDVSYNLSQYRKKFKYWILNNKNTILFLKCNTSRDKLLSLIENPEKQLSLTISGNFLSKYNLNNYYKINKLYLYLLNFHDIKKICKNIYAKKIFFKKCVLNENIKFNSDIEIAIENSFERNIALHNAGNIQKLSLSYSSVSINDILLLKNIKILYLSNLKNINDISGLSELKYLKNVSLINCININDISPLKDIPILDLSDSRSIKDVNILKNAKHLNLSNCHRIKDISMLGNIVKLSLFGCYRIRDVSMLGNVIDLDLSYCINLTNVNMLGKVHKLNLSYCYRITSISELKNIKKLIVKGCKLVN